MSSRQQQQQQRTKEKEDAAIAQALQEKYRLEFIQRQERKNHRARATAPDPSPSNATAETETTPFYNVGIDDGDDIDVYPLRSFDDEDAAVEQQGQEADDKRRRRILQEEEDAALARRLSQQEPTYIPSPQELSQDAALARQLASQSAMAAGAVASSSSSSRRRSSRRSNRSNSNNNNRIPPPPPNCPPLPGGSSGGGLSDEQLARRLMQQEQLSAASMAPSFLPRSSAPGAERVMVSPFGVQVQPVSATGNNNNNNNNLMDADARLAQQLYDEDLARRYGTAQTTSRTSRTATMARPPQDQVHNDDDAAAAATMSDFLSPETTMDRGVSFFLDERVSNASDDYDDPAMDQARRVAQELEDEETARRYATYEQEAASRRQAQAVSAEQVQQNTRRHNMYYYMGFVPCCVLGTVVAFLLVFFVFGNNDVDDLPGFGGDWGNFDDWIDIDPFDPEFDDDNVLGGSGNQGDPNSAFRWSNKGKGLELEIENALDDTWQTTFGVAIQNWEKGDPDALSLSVKRVDYEFECDPLDGAMKVCNGNYGDTGWRGLNEVLLDRRSNTITASSARMNEFYLGSGGGKNAEQLQADQRQYTMCHEIGHGFGLPHWDENFYNKDLGNCMDYTNNPTANMQPSESNYIFLADLYGSVDGTYVRNTTSSSGIQLDDKKDGETSSTKAEDGPGGGGGGPGKKGGGGRRRQRQSEQEPSLSKGGGRSRRRQSLQEQSLSNKDEDDDKSLPLPEWVIPTYRQIRTQLITLAMEGGGQQQQQQQDVLPYHHRLLHSTEFGKSIEISLDGSGGDGELGTGADGNFVVQLHFLF